SEYRADPQTGSAAEGCHHKRLDQRRPALTEFVLDVSVALAWFIDNPVPKYAAQVRHALQAGRRAVVPPIWQLEIANAFVVAERRRMLSAEDVTLSLTQLEQLLTQTIESLNDFVSAKYA